MQLTTPIPDDTIATRIKWDDVGDDDHNKALIESVFTPHEKGGLFSIRKADIVINDSLWSISPSNFIDLDDGRVLISNIMFSHNQQWLRADGYLPMTVEDTLRLQLNRFDLSLFDMVTRSHGIDLEGYVTGMVEASNLKGNPVVFADLNIDQLAMNDKAVGDVIVKSAWDNADESVVINREVEEQKKRKLKAEGMVYPNRKDKNLDIVIDLDSLNLALAEPFVGDAVSRMQGYGLGSITVGGTFKQPSVVGSVKVQDGGCKIGFLNTFYTFSPTIFIDSNVIELRDMVLVDTLGNWAPVEGKIHHDYLKDFSLDLKMHPRDFLAMNTSLKDNDSFYGFVVADGLVEAHGPVSDVNMRILAKTGKGTKLTLPLNRTSTVSDNDFIVFVEKAVETDEEVEKEETSYGLKKKKTNFAIDLDVDVTNDASIKIYLPGDIGTIDAAGSGNIKLGTSSTESMSLYGNYAISNGRFQLNFMNMLQRTFNLKQGSTITWSGSPTDGRIDATGAYTVKTSLSTLGIQVDSTSGGNTVNAECLIHLKDALLNPTITFGLHLPNASEDIQRTVFSVIDTTNQAVMTSQVMSLLVLGSFANLGTGGGSANYLDAITSFGTNLNLGGAWSLGLSYHSSLTSNFDELQMALKTELFENRLIIETNFGVISDNSSSTKDASNLVGEFDIRYKLSKDGRLMATFYNHSNYNSNFLSFSFDKLAPYTQGLGLRYSKSFNAFRDIFKRKKTVVPMRPLIGKQKEPIIP